MLIAAISDIHSPRYLNEFFIALKSLPQTISLVLLAGDLTDEGKVLHFDPIYNALKNFKVIATFGNEDYYEIREQYKKKYPDIIWLDDSKVTIDVDNKKLMIVGSDGVLEMPTKWQALHGYDKTFYENKKKKIEEMLCSENGVIKILLTHYAPTYDTLYGERERAYPQLGYRLLNELKCLPNIAIHGHAHYSKKTYSVVKGVRVYNVALPANKKFTIIEL
ncbi:MAG: metallophosphoesterase [Sulfolobaceae archaeon]|nr:metallophosphoesterase [Sulfolobaceae archaeon]